MLPSEVSISPQRGTRWPERSPAWGSSTCPPQQSLLLPSPYPGGCRAEKTRQAFAMHARDLALPAQPPFCCFSHRCSFHFLSWQFRLGVEAEELCPAPRGSQAVPSQGWGLSFPTSKGYPRGHAPPGPVLNPKQLPLAWFQAPCLFWSEEDCFQLPSAHTHFRAAWTKSPSFSLQPLQPLTWDVSLASPSLPCLSKAPHQGHCTCTHTHRGTHMHTLAATCSHTYTCGHTHMGKHSQTCSFVHRDTSTFRETSPHVHVHIHTQRDKGTHGIRG